MNVLNMLKAIEREQLEVREEINARIQLYQRILDHKPNSIKWWIRSYKFRRRIKQEYKTALLIKKVMEY